VEQHQCIIIGSGFSGLCMAIKLREAGLDDFLILEKAGDLGGTWRDNAYPGAECDVPSALYSLSFERKTDWDYQWSEQPQILDYIHAVANKHRLRERIRFHSELSSAQYDEATARWRLQLADGSQFESQFLVSAVGQLHLPNTPVLPGQEAFEGAAFHSASWNNEVDLKGKRVAVIGNAASAVQFVPRIAPDVAQLTIYQRSANWLAPKQDKPYTDRQKALLKVFPFIKSLARLRTYLRNELLVYPVLRGNKLAGWALKKVCMDYLNSTVKDPALRRKLIPDYPLGAKRMLTADGYYEALCRDNVSLIDTPIDSLTPSAIKTTDGVEREADVIIYATGFITNPFLSGIEITGRGGRSLAEHWREGAHAYLGVATHHFPNLFFLYGPNTNLGHNSILLMSEAQVAHIIKAIGHARGAGAASVEVRDDVETIYNARLQERLGTMAWSAIEDSWYKSGNRVTNNWPGSVGEYRRVLRAFRPADFIYAGEGVAQQ
jgi:cation diffusion facilitator CzcD-associated flavoprotein CzcO